jgi:hypothetical protein
MRPYAIALALSLSPTLATIAYADTPAVEIPAADRAKMSVCTDGKSHYVAIGPHERLSHQLYYGDGKNMSEVGTDPSGMLPGTDFFEPRFVLPTANDNFRGIDYRIISSVEYDDSAHTCSLRCGEHKQPLTVMPAADAQKLVTAATFHKSLRTREPYALARDDRGNYYLVDHGNTPETKNNFRVFVGKKGALKLQKMKDVASDSEGEVFSTSTGDLRFVTSHEKNEYSWVRGEKSTHLLALPVRENMTLIYTTLGVYAGERLGNPCDDM